MDYDARVVQINNKLRKLLYDELRQEYNSGYRVFEKDIALKKFKCYECAFQDYLNLNGLSGYPCIACKDRPDRNKDKSEFMQDLTEEERERQHKISLDEEQNKGKFDF